MKKTLLTMSFLLSCTVPAYALDVGDISSFIYSGQDMLSKEIKNTTNTGRLINIKVERISNPQTSVNQIYDVSCDGQWRDMTDALWVSTPWTDSNGNAGMMNKANVKFSIAMDSPESLRTINNAVWYGEVSASGEINVKATWRNAR